MLVDLRGKVALVTGASSGIGRQIAVDLAWCGASVVVNYRHNFDGARETHEKLLALPGDLGHLIVQADVSKEEEVARLFDEIEAALGCVDLLVNNAAILGERKQIDELTAEAFRDVMETNLLSVFLCSRRAMGPMKRRGAGRIVNISSSAARTGGGPGIGAYAASKAAVNSLTRSMARELAAFGITVNAVSPGVIQTDMHSSTPADVHANLISRIPVKSAGEPADVSGAVVYLMADETKYLVGEIVEVNGGLLMA